MKRFVLSFAAAAAFVAGVAAVSAQSDPIAQRKAILKGWGDATKQPGAVLKGEAKFDLAAAQATLKAYATDSVKLVTLFPDTSKTGGDTAALPKIWDEKAKFEGIYKKIGEDATKAAAAIKDEASFKAEFGKVLGNCKACHDDYRAKKS